jgi:hypothetical protein
VADERTINLRPPIWLPILVAVLLGGFYIVGKQIEVRGSSPATIAVMGEGKVTAVPNVAQLNFGVTTGPRPTAKDAIAVLERNMTAIIAAVKKEGVEDKDIQTQSLTMYPSYDYMSGKQTLRGYEASQSLQVKVRNLDKVGSVLTAATAAGANQAGGVVFTIDEPETLRAQAREKAIKQAQQKAETLADQLDMDLGRVKSFQEGGANPPPIMMETLGRGMGGGGDSSLPVPAGEQEIVVQVTITYELK